MIHWLNSGKARFCASGASRPQMSHRRRHSSSKWSAWARSCDCSFLRSAMWSSIPFNFSWALASCGADMFSWFCRP